MLKSKFKEREAMDFYNIPIVDYLLSIGEPIESVGHNYYQHKQHDSLKINQRKNYFVWNSRSSEKNARGGVVQYLQIMYGLSLKETLSKLEQDLEGKELPKVSKKSYPQNFKYRVKEAFVPLETQRYLVAKRKIPNRIVREFFSYNLISQNENNEVIFKWYKGEEVVGFTKQGTRPLTEEEKEQYHTKRDYFKYVAPTTEENTMWGFNYMKGEPKHLFFFESEIDLLSYYTLFEQELNKQGNYWLISINGLTIEKVYAFLKYGLENLELKINCESLHVCFDNDIAGKQSLNTLQPVEFNHIPFENDITKNFKDWNEELQNKK